MPTHTILRAVEPRALPVGAEVGGFRVERLTGESPRGWTAAEAVAPDGQAVRLWVSARTTSRDHELAGRVERLSRLHELRGAAELPLLAPVGAGRDGDRLFFAQPHPPAGTLADRLREGRLQIGEAVRLLSQVAGGLVTLRAFRLPHAHLTPERVVLVEAGAPRALLTEFGFVPPRVSTAHPVNTLAAANYLAPEVAAGAPLEPRGTVYALACIVVECLTGAPPFPYDQPEHVLAAHRAEAPPRVSQRSDLPRDLDRVLSAALRKDPAQRPGSPADLMRATQTALRQRGVTIPVLRPRPVREPVDAGSPALPSLAAPQRLMEAAPPEAARGALTDELPPAFGRSGSAGTPAPAAARRRSAETVPTATARGGSAETAPPTAARGGSAETAPPAAARMGSAETAAPAAARRARASTVVPEPDPLTRGSSERSRGRRGARPAVVAAGLALMLTGGAGFAIGHARTAAAPVVKTAAASPARIAARQDALRRAADLRAVATAMDGLRADRENKRRDLRLARTAAGQAAAAAALARAYDAARSGLTAGAPGPRSAELDAALGSTAIAYRRLAKAGLATDAGAFRAARSSVVRHERAVDGVLVRAADA